MPWLDYVMKDIISPKKYLCASGDIFAELS